MGRRCPSTARAWACAAVLVLTALAERTLSAQTPGPPIEQVTFEQATERAVANNPTMARAMAGILRAESILQQARAASLPSVDAALTTTVINPVPSFGGSSINPRTQLQTSLGFAVPLLAPVRWAERNQATDQVVVSERSVDDVRRGIAVAAAQAYLQVIAERRVLELNERARATALAHFEYARQRLEGGLGSRLNLLRAQQELSSDEVRVEDARLAIRRAQEALGVLLAADGPMDAAGEPPLDIPPELTVASGSAAQSPTADSWLLQRPDVRLVAARQSAAERVLRDSWRDHLPSLTGLFDPQAINPSGLFQPGRTWSARVVFAVPLFDSGQRRGLASERRSQLDLVRAERASLERQARSEVRAAWEAVRSTERAVASARVAAEQAGEVVRITDIAFRAGATTNIELIDAQRQARDAETDAAIAEDAARRARLELMVAVGQFPQ
jgi:outer membrane protein TolC